MFKAAMWLMRVELYLTEQTLPLNTEPLLSSICHFKSLTYLVVPYNTFPCFMVLFTWPLFCCGEELSAICMISYEQRPLKQTK